MSATDRNKRNVSGDKARQVRVVDNFIPTSESTVKTVWYRQCLAIIQASMACCGDSFTWIFLQSFGLLVIVYDNISGRG
jgi:hypothetical protein